MMIWSGDGRGTVRVAAIGRLGWFHGFVKGVKGES
jgi:hypothetical protein